MVYALGIHPMYVHRAADEDLERLEQALEACRDDPRLVAVGEIGLDFFVEQIREGAPRERQVRFYEAQLRLARRFDLPVILHVRRSQDSVLKSLRRLSVSGGIAHAFNGSTQQATGFRQLGFCLGMGGAMTYPRALQIRRIALEADDEALVLETDSPDIAPHWLLDEAQGAGPVPGERGLRRNTPGELPRIAQCLADLRGQSLGEVARACSRNTLRVLPRLGIFLAGAA